MKKKLRVPDPIKGDVFSNLTVIEDTYLMGPKGKLFKVQCACEKKTIFLVRKDALTSGNTKGCGCLSGKNLKYIKRKIKYSDLQVGEKFERLTVMSNIPVYPKRKFLCLCICGNSVLVPIKHLMTGTTKSCGCLSVDTSSTFCKSRAQPEVVAITRKVLSAYQKSARERDIDWNLTEEEFSTLIFDNCFYCALEPSNSIVSRLDNRIYYNGVDRIDSKNKYSKDNCVSCCKVCNMMKGSKTFKQFIDHLYRLSKNLDNLKKSKLYS